MKTLTFSVNLTFSESVEKDEDIQEVMENVKLALVREIDNGMGLASDVQIGTQLKLRFLSLILKPELLMIF